MNEELSDFIGKNVVIDTKSSYLYMGVLKSVGEYFIDLDDVDVHDHSEYNKSKELYVMDSQRHGLKINRKAVKIVLNEIVSLSLLEDVIEY